MQHVTNSQSKMLATCTNLAYDNKDETSEENTGLAVGTNIDAKTVTTSLGVVTSHHMAAKGHMAKTIPNSMAKTSQSSMAKQPPNDMAATKQQVVVNNTKQKMVDRCEQKVNGQEEQNLGHLVLQVGTVQWVSALQHSNAAQTANYTLRNITDLKHETGQHKPCNNGQCQQGNTGVTINRNKSRLVNISKSPLVSASRTMLNNEISAMLNDSSTAILGSTNRTSLSHTCMGTVPWLPSHEEKVLSYQQNGGHDLSTVQQESVLHPSNTV
jgi:hypothetical protein